MLQLLLMILKILGIILLVILGMILAVLLIVLFVPVRYRGDVTFDGKPEGGVLVSWLFKLVTVRVNYDGSLKALVKVLWFKLFEQTLWSSEDTEEAVDELGDDEFFAETDSSVAEVSQVSAEKTILPESKPIAKAEEGTSSETAKQAKQPDEKPKAVVNKAEVKQDSVVADADKKKPVVEKKTAKAETEKLPVKPAQKEKSSQTENTKKQESQSEVPEEEKQPAIEAIIEKIVSAVTNIIEKIQGIYQNLSGKYTAGKDKIETVRVFLADAENQNTIRLLLRQVLKLFKHILPRKISGRVRFGFDDPATTGQILTYISPFYGMYAKSLTIEPVFDEKVMEGELHLKGHIRVASLLWIVVRVILNKNFRTLVKKFLKSRK